MGVEMLQVLQVCKFAFRFFVFSCFPSAVFVWVPSFFRPYTRVRILLMCLSFSSRVLRYKNMLCNTSVIQSITKKVSGNPYNFSFVCLLVIVKRSTFASAIERDAALQTVCDWLGETNVGEFSLTAVCTQYLTLAGLRERERIRRGEDGRPAFYGSFEKNFFKKNFRNIWRLR